MDNEKKWPNPPEFDLNIPDIPDKYTCFGLEFILKDGVPILNDDLEFEDLDVQKIEDLVEDSVQKFKEIIKNNYKIEKSNSLIEELRDIHLDINEKINKAKLWDVKKNLKKK